MDPGYGQFTCFQGNLGVRLATQVTITAWKKSRTVWTKNDMAHSEHTAIKSNQKLQELFLCGVVSHETWTRPDDDARLIFTKTGPYSADSKMVNASLQGTPRHRHFEQRNTSATATDTGCCENTSTLKPPRAETRAMCRTWVHRLEARHTSH